MLRSLPNVHIETLRKGAFERLSESVHKQVELREIPLSGASEILSAAEGLQAMTGDLVVQRIIKGYR
jgi:hypothetical protein